MGTLRRRITDTAEVSRARRSSRSSSILGATPCTSAGPRCLTSGPASRRPTFWKHIGLYVYRREFLLRLAALPPTPLERAESLEQLRALEHGFRIGTVETDTDTIEIDTPEDLERVTAARRSRPPLSEHTWHRPNECGP